MLISCLDIHIKKRKLQYNYLAQMMMIDGFIQLMRVIKVMPFKAQLTFFC